MSKQITLYNKKGKSFQAELLLDEIMFPEELWRYIKEYAGYSDNYPIALPYVKYMVGARWSNCQTKILNLKFLTFDSYIEYLWGLYYQFEYKLQKLFNPIQWK